MNAQETSSHNHLIQLNLVYNFWLARNSTYPSQNTPELQTLCNYLLEIMFCTMVKGLDIVTTCVSP